MKNANSGNDLKNMKIFTKAFQLSMKALNDHMEEGGQGTYLTPNEIAEFAATMGAALKIIKATKDQSEAVLRSKFGADLDEEDQEKITEELAKLCRASTEIMEASGQLSFAFKDRAAPHIKGHLMDYFAANLKSFKKLDDDELIDAACFFCDYIEHASGADHQLNLEIGQKFLEVFGHTENIDVKQSVVYGLGVIAMQTPEGAFSVVKPQVQHCIHQMVSAKDAYEEENVVATECAISSLGKLVYFQNLGDEAAKHFLSLLPLKNEFEEARNTHKLLVQQAGKLAGVKAELKAAVERILAEGEEEILPKGGKEFMEKALQ